MVSILTGEVYIEELDFFIPGLFDLSFNRNYISSSTYDGPLGYGWYHSFDQTIAYDKDNNILFRDNQGFSIKFNPIQFGENTKNEDYDLVLTRSKAGFEIASKFGVTLLFINFKGNKVFKLARIEDKFQNGISFFYDDNYQLSTIIDSRCRTIHCKYNTNNKLVRMDLFIKGEVPQRLCEYAYDQYGNLVVFSDTLYNKVGYGYRDHLMTRHTNRNGYSTFYEYDISQNVARCVTNYGDGGRYRYKYKYDSQSLVTTVTNSFGSKIQYYFNPNGSTKEIIDKFGFIRFEYYNEDQENKIQITNGLETALFVNNEENKEYKVFDTQNNFITSKWNATYDKLTLTDEIGATKIVNLNDHYYVSSIINEVGEAEEYLYDNRGIIKNVKRPNGNTTSYDWDESLRLLKISDEIGLVCMYKFNNMNALTSYIDSLGNEWKFEYQQNQKLRKIICPNKYVWTITYNGEGKILEECSYDGKIRYEYSDELIAAIEEEPHEVNKFEYVQEKVSSIINPLGNMHSVEYDERYRIKKEKPLGSGVISYEYDAEDNRISLHSPLFHTDAHFDNLGRAARAQDNRGNIFEYEYDKRSLISSIRSHASLVKFSYDNARRVVKEIQNDFVIEYEYDTLGNVHKIKDSFGGSTYLSFDKRGRCTSIKDTNNVEHFFKYDLANNLIERSVGSIFREQLEYDFNGSLINQVVSIAKKIVLIRRYTYFENGELRRIEDSKRGTIDYEYDNGRRLVRVLKDGNLIEEYTYDGANNILSAPWSNNENIILHNGISPKQISENIFEYDIEGNLTSISNNRGKKSFEYNGFGQLSKFKFEDTETEYKYDGLGRRINKRGKYSNDFFWMLNTLYGEWNGKDFIRYLSYPKEREFGVYDLLSISDPKSTNICVTDHLGTPIEFYNLNGEITWSVEYESFARIKSCVGKITNPVRLIGQYHDVESGLYYNRFRYYNPETGYYITRDPKTQTNNLHPFRYCHPNPIINIDPFGMVSGETIGETMRLVKEAMRQAAANNTTPGTLPGAPLVGDYKSVKAITTNTANAFQSGHTVPSRLLDPDQYFTNLWRKQGVPQAQFDSMLAQVKKELPAMPMHQNFNCGLYKRLENALFEETGNLTAAQMCKRAKLLAKVQNALLGKGVGDATLAAFRNLGLPCA